MSAIKLDELLQKVGPLIDMAHSYVDFKEDGITVPDAEYLQWCNEERDIIKEAEQAISQAENSGVTQ